MWPGLCWKGFPRDPADLGKRLRKASAALRKADNLELVFERTRDRRRDKQIEIRRVEHPTEVQANSAQPSTDQTTGVTEATAPGKVIALRDRKSGPSTGPPVRRFRFEGAKACCYPRRYPWLPLDLVFRLSH